ncbi:MAG: hypothetical protein ACYCO3_13205 [Mycobacteriales bacterium]
MKMARQPTSLAEAQDPGPSEPRRSRLAVGKVSLLAALALPLAACGMATAGATASAGMASLRIPASGGSATTGVAASVPHPVMTGVAVGGGAVTGGAPSLVAPMRWNHPSITWGGSPGSTVDFSGIFPLWPKVVTPQTDPLVTIKITNRFTASETVSYDLIITSGKYTPKDIPGFYLSDVAVPYAAWPHGVWDYQKAYPTAVHQVVVAPGATVEVKLSWPGRRLDGTPAPPGHYLAAVAVSGYLRTGPTIHGSYVGTPPSGQTGSGDWPYLIALQG